LNPGVYSVSCRFFKVKQREFLSIRSMVVDTDADFAANVARVPLKEYADFQRVCKFAFKLMEWNAALVSPPPP
jgi:hypothetical protein